MSGKLYLIPAPLDFGCSEQAPLSQVMPAGTLEVAARLDHWICENAKSTRAYLKRIHDLRPLSRPLREQQITELPRQVHKKGDHDGTFDARPLLAAAKDGHDIGLVSEAGMPAIADPGSSVVRAAHDLGMAVIAMVGPASLLLALVSSGLNGQNFAFHGYLPQDDAERAVRIRQLEALALKTGQTQIFIETPYRNSLLLAAFLGALQDTTRLAVSWGLTLPQGNSRSATVRQWKKDASSFPHGLPAVFAFGR